MPYIIDAQTQHGTQLRPTTVVHEPDVRSQAWYLFMYYAFLTHV